MLSASELRHRIDIEKPIHTQNTETGIQDIVWVSAWSRVPAKVTPVSVREFIAAQAVQSQVVARIVIRYREGLTAQMRIKFRGAIYNPQGWLPDPDSGLEYLTAPCTMGVNNG
jgi:SPP1 family predicted phage head-tail adaptor